MRAVNLVPAEARSGGLSGGKSGGMVYAALGALVLVLLGTVVFALGKKDQAEAEQQLATLQQSTQAFTTAAGQYAPYESAASDAAQRITTVHGLTDARFDWAGTLRDLSRLIPASTQVYSLSASVSDSGSGAASGGASSQFRSKVSSPAVTMNGCSKSQDTVATLVTNLQALRRVTNVTLESSGKVATQGSGSSACSIPNAYEFVLVVFFDAGKAQDSGSVVPGTTPTGTTTASATTTETAAPASTTPASGGTK